MLKEASTKKSKHLYIKAHRKRCKTWAGRLAWLGHLLDVQKVAGPNPVRPPTPFPFPINRKFLKSFLQ